jgi:transcriptional regulator with XRE-family HTH domain
MKQVREATDVLKGLGERLRSARLGRNDTMATFGERLGVSERTVRAMEHGLPTVQVGAWLNALWILDELESLNAVLAPRESLLDRARNVGRPRRQRASRRQP